MGACCSADVRPVLRIRVRRVRNMKALDTDGESDCYVLCKYGDLERSRYEEKSTKAMKTTKGAVELNDTVDFITGGPSTKQNLLLQIMDQDILKADDEGGKVTIYFPSHPDNPEVEGDMESSMSVSRGGGQRPEYFLPREWNAYNVYDLQSYRSDGTRAAVITVEIAFWDKKGKIINSKTRNEDEVTLLPSGAL